MDTVGTEEAGLKFDRRDTWGPGPWDNEPDRAEWRDAVTGLPCLAVRSRMGNWCGYVAAPPGHPWHGMDNDTVPIETHGGCTYAAPCSGQICHVPQPGEPDDVWWIGFDCGHAYDIVPAFAAAYGTLGPLADWEYRDLDFVKIVCSAMAIQIHAAAL